MLRGFFFLVIFWGASLAANDTYLFLRGYIGPDLITAVRGGLAEARTSDGGRLLIQVNSSSGDINEVLSFAQEIYDLKERRDKYVIVFVQGKAVGPAAILPFLADELIVTPMAVWGDIPYGVKGEMTTEQIATAARGLITDTIKHRETLRRLAIAMVDPHHQVANIPGSSFDPLVLNREQMESLGLVHEVLTDQAFASKFVTPDLREQPEKEIAYKRENIDLLKRYIQYSPTEENLFGYLHIGNDRSIDQSTYIYVKFALSDFVKKGVRAVILDLNTPGGEVLSALKIVNLLQRLDANEQIPVIAFVHNWAVSAGAMLAYACRFIAIEPNSLMGAAEPVIVGKEGGMTTASEKVNSALRAEFANLASFYGRNPLIAEAMVDKDIILVNRKGKITPLRSNEEVINSGSHPDVMITGPGKLLTLNAKEMVEFKVANFEVPLSPLPKITEEEQEKGMWPASKSLVFQEPFLKKIPHAVMVDYHDWRVGFFSILSHPAIATLLFVGLIIGLYIEINTPGFGVPGSIALGCLAFILLSSFASHAINWIEIIILCVGLILLALELFVIPGFGIIGIMGIVLTIIGLFALMLPGIDQINVFNPETFELVGMTFIERLAWLCGGLLFAIIVIVLLARFVSHRFFRFSKLVLKGEQESRAGYVSGIPRKMMPQKGELGETVSPLRPSGKVHVGESLYDAITLGGYIDKNVHIEVVKVEGSKVVVRQIKEEEKGC
ncbi:MAG: serine protease [Chlamydiia bacterium]|nr:serine protease [Chlamydiia bacterium]